MVTKSARADLVTILCIQGDGMREYKKEIINVTSREIILSLADISMPLIAGFIPSSRRSVREYLEERGCERAQFSQRLKYLKRKGLIQVFTEGKEKYFELTPRGAKHAYTIDVENITIKRPETWDGLWRIVAFDIPNTKKNERESFRCKLLELGFLKIQESLYVYPFECTHEVGLLMDNLSINKHVLIMISEVIQGEESLIARFLDNKVLNRSDITKK